ncbi:hypothetical protein SLA2020_132680 [Shorea laevis]
MTTQAATTFNGNLKKAVAGLRRINLEGLRWRVFDAKGQVLGRLASQMATVVQGKDKPTYTPQIVMMGICALRLTPRIYALLGENLLISSTAGILATWETLRKGV